MPKQEDEYAKELKDAGVELPELDEVEESEEDDETTEAAENQTEKKSEEKSKDDSKEDDKEPLQDQKEEKEPRKRSIYDDLKAKKNDLRTEKELREQAERERDEWKVKAEAVRDAATPTEKKEAQDALDAYAEQFGADPEAIRKLRDVFFEGFNPKNEKLEKDLEEFQNWKKQNQASIEKTMFEEEFKASTPAFKELFPKVTPEELDAIKGKLDELSHTTEFHDKPLDYIAFKHQKSLSALISPKKRGMEPKGRVDAEDLSSEFNPTADLTKMTLKERDTWEKQYNEMMKSDGLAKSANGKKFII